jgi:hypothetical protein
MFRMALVVPVLVGCLASSALADDDPKGFVCSFKSGQAWTYEAGKFESKSPTEINFEISAVDLEGQTAVLALPGVEQKGALKIVRALNANHFLEVVNEGFLNLTTIYDKGTSGTEYPAVHSRHFGVLGQPLFAQYAGSCQAK